MKVGPLSQLFADLHLQTTTTEPTTTFLPTLSLKTPTTKPLRAAPRKKARKNCTQKQARAAPALQERSTELTRNCHRVRSFDDLLHSSLGLSLPRTHDDTPTTQLLERHVSSHRQNNRIQTIGAERHRRTERHNTIRHGQPEWRRRTERGHVHRHEWRHHAVSRSL